MIKKILLLLVEDVNVEANSIFIWSDSNFCNTIFFPISIKLPVILFQWIVSGLFGVDGVNVLRPVAMDAHIEEGG